MMRLPMVVLAALPLCAQTPAELVRQGEQIFNKTCATGYCHVLKGGSGGGAPRLAARGFDEQYINAITTRGVPGTPMPPFGSAMPRRDLNAVVAYVAALNGITNPNLNFGPFGARGGAASEPSHPLFHDPVRGFGRCATCHEVNGLGISVATPISKVPEDVAALKALATPQVSTVTLAGESMPALVVSKSAKAVIFYDLITPPPVLRTVDPASIQIAEGSTWHHASVITAYTDAELGAILTYLRSVVHP